MPTAAVHPAGSRRLCIRVHAHLRNYSHCKQVGPQLESHGFDVTIEKACSQALNESVLLHLLAASFYYEIWLVEDHLHQPVIRRSLTKCRHDHVQNINAAGLHAQFLDNRGARTPAAAVMLVTLALRPLCPRCSFVLRGGNKTVSEADSLRLAFLPIDRAKAIHS